MEIVAGEPTQQGQLLRVTYRRVRKEFGQFVLDSDIPDKGNPLAPLYRDMVGVPFDVVLNRDAQPQARGMEKVWNRISKKHRLARIPTEMAYLKRHFGAEPVEGAISWIRGELPPGPVAIGDSWEAGRNVATPQFGPVEVNVTSVLKGVQRASDQRLALIQSTGSVSKSFKEGELKQAPAGLGKMRVEIQVTETIKRDLATAQTRQRVADVRSTSMFAVELDEGKTEEHSLTLDLKASMTLSPGGYGEQNKDSTE
jgi:hypothetical protein